MVKKKAGSTKQQIPPPPNANVSWEEQAAYFEKYGLDELIAAGYVRKLTPQEQKEADELAELAKARIAARENRAQLNLSFPANDLARFLQHAKHKHIPPSTLARAWILERLDQESKPA